MASTEERVKNIVVDLLGVDADRVVPAARFREDLEADSLDLVELIMAFEEEFGGEITDEDAQKKSPALVRQFPIFRRTWVAPKRRDPTMFSSQTE